MHMGTLSRQWEVQDCGWGRGPGEDAGPGIPLGIPISRQMGFKATGVGDITGETFRERGAQDKVLELPLLQGRGLASALESCGAP